MASLDHIVVGARSLAEGRDWMEARLGSPPGGGGQHPTMGTVNALWRLGDAYLEVIAIDPEAPPPDRPRWFGLDDADTQARLRERPRLLAWVIRPDGPLAEAAARAAVDVGPVERHHRGALHWHLTVPGDGLPVLGGAVPGLIEWPEGVAPPPERLPDQGLSLVRLTVPARPGAEAALVSLGAASLATLGPQSGGLQAEIATSRGKVLLD